MKYDCQDSDKWSVEFVNSQTDFRLTLGGDAGLTIGAIPPDVLVDLYLALGQTLKQHLIEERLDQFNADGLLNWAAEGLERYYDENPHALREGWRDIVEDGASEEYELDGDNKRQRD